MEIIEEKRNNIVILKPVGRLDSNTSGEFESVIQQHSADGGNMIVNFESLEYISSAGLRVIIKAVKDLAAQGGSFVTCGMQDHVREIFEISGFDVFVPIFADIEAALKG